MLAPTAGLLILIDALFSPWLTRGRWRP